MHSRPQDFSPSYPIPIVRNFEIVINRSVKKKKPKFDGVRGLRMPSDDKPENLKFSWKLLSSPFIL